MVCCRYFNVSKVVWCWCCGLSNYALLQIFRPFWLGDCLGYFLKNWATLFLSLLVALCINDRAHRDLSVHIERANMRSGHCSGSVFIGSTSQAVRSTVLTEQPILHLVFRRTHPVRASCWNSFSLQLSTIVYCNQYNRNWVRFPSLRGIVRALPLSG
jgi:hypothetical protein